MLKTAMVMTAVIAIALVANELDAVRDPVRGAKVIAPADGVYELTAVYELLLDDGVTLAAGEPVYDDVIYSGIVRNDGDTPILMLAADGSEVEIPPGGVLRSRCSPSCSTTGCREDEYACCMWDDRGCARCMCLREDENPPNGLSCESSGGSGCSMGSTARVAPREDWAR